MSVNSDSFETAGFEEGSEIRGRQNLRSTDCNTREENVGRRNAARDRDQI